MRRWVRAAEKEMFDKVNWNVYVVCQVERISLKCLQYKDPNYSIFNRCSTRDVLQKRDRRVFRSVGGGFFAFGRLHASQLSSTLQMTLRHGPESVRIN